MSLLPYIFDDFSMRPSRILDQHFGLGLVPEDLIAPLTITNGFLPRPYQRLWRSLAAGNDSGSTINVDKDKFQVNLDVQQFAPNEITVKVTGNNSITVEGKHEEKQDEHGYISRQFVRRYVLPEGHDINSVQSNLSSDGVLTITAPTTAVKEAGERQVPVVQTGQPSKCVEAAPKGNQNGEASA